VRRENHPVGGSRRHPSFVRRGALEYKSALDRLKRAEDAYGRAIWIEKVGYDGRPDVYYKYDSNGRLMKHTRKVYG